MTSVKIGAPFELTDHFGQSVTDRSFGEKHTLVFFGFTNCRVVCPERLGVLTEALEAIGPLADKIRPLYISVDPARDDPERMRSFLEAKFPRFLGLTGNPDALAEVRTAYKVFAKRAEEDLPDGGYDVPHTAMAFLMSPEGDYVTHFFDAATPDEIATRLKALLA